MDNAKKLQMAIKRKTVLRDTLHGTSGYKVKNCKVSFIDNGWYNFIIDGYTFDCKWNTLLNTTRFYFKNNKTLDCYNYCSPYGVEEKMVKYASSLYFGNGSNLIPVLWVLGEVLCNRKSYYFRNIE